MQKRGRGWSSILENVTRVIIFDSKEIENFLVSEKNGRDTISSSVKFLFSSKNRDLLISSSFPPYLDRAIFLPSFQLYLLPLSPFNHPFPAFIFDSFLVETARNICYPRLSSYIPLIKEIISALLENRFMELFLTGFFSSLFTGIGQRIDPEVNRIEGRKFNRGWGRGGEKGRENEIAMPFVYQTWRVYRV